MQERMLGQFNWTQGQCAEQCVYRVKVYTSVLYKCIRNIDLLFVQSIRDIDDLVSVVSNLNM